MDGVNGVALAVFIALFALVTLVGFLAARWRRAADLEHLDEWASAAASSAVWSRGSSSGATSTRPTRSSPCPH